MASNPATGYKIHHVGLHWSGLGVNEKLLNSGAGGSVAQGKVWRDGPLKRSTKDMMKGQFFRMLAQKSKLESQISVLQARNNEIHVQKEGLRNQVASLRAAVDSLEQGLEPAKSTTQAHGSTTNEARAFFQHSNYTVPEARGDTEHGHGVPGNLQISRPDLIVTRGKSMMEIPSPNAESRIARFPNMDTRRQPQHTGMLKPAPQFVAVKRNGSTICLNALMAQKAKQGPLLALLRSFGIPWYSYNSITAPISRPSEPSNRLTPGNAPFAKVNSAGVRRIC